MSDRPGASSDRSSGQISNRLDSWKEIAAYLRRDIRTVQRWERDAGLPVHRRLHHKQGSVYALPEELDAWWHSHSQGPDHSQSARDDGSAPDPYQQPVATVEPGAGFSSRLKLRRAALATLVGLAAVVVLAVASRRPAEEAARVTPTFQKLTFAGGVALAPSLAPDGKWFVYDAYTKYSDGEQVYLQAVGGLNPVCLTCGRPGRAMEPVFSPDGDRIAFSTAESGGTGLYVMARDGSSPRRLTSTGHHPTWSPDGKMIAYSTGWTHWLPSYGPAGQNELWIVELDSGEAQMVYGGDALDPAWSPGGHRIAFAATSRDGSTRDVFTIPPTGGRPTRVTGHEADDWYPTWSAAGDALYFVSDRAGTRGLWRVAIDERTGAPRGPAEVIAAPTASVTFPRTGPAGTLLYSDATASRNIGVLRFDPASGSVAGGLTPVTTGTNYWRRPHPSPDGEWMVAELAATAADRGIFIMRRDGSGLRRLTDERASDRSPRFSPDGRRVVFESDRSGSAGIWVVDADGRNLRRVTPVDRSRRWTLARWSPDGTRVAAWEQPAGRIAVFAADGSSAETGTLLQLPNDEAAQLAWYEWTPDGRHVALDLRDSVAVYSLEIGTSRTTPSPIGAGLITGWLPDSSRLLMSDYVNRKLIVLDIRTWRSTEAPYPDAVEGDATFGLSADGRTLAAEHGTSTADIWMMRLPGRR